MSRFDYVKYDETAVKVQSEFKELFIALEGVVDVLPNGRAKSVIMTKLEEAYMWTGKAIRDHQIARGGSNEDVPERG